jgi:hypothetical protein
MNKYILGGLIVCIVLIFFIAVIVYKHQTIPERFESEQSESKQSESEQLPKKFGNALTSEQRIKMLGAMLALHEVFERMNIWYIICFGSLIGAVRHHGLIPWDDDMDILVKYKDIDRIREALKELEKMGFGIEENWKLFKVYGDEKKELCIDLFFIADQHDDSTKVMRCLTKSTELTDGKQCETLPKDHVWWWKDFSFPQKYLETRKRFTLNGLSLWGPVDAWHMLRYMYGDNFLSMCQTPVYDHKTSTYIVPTSETCPESLPVPQF